MKADYTITGKMKTGGNTSALSQKSGFILFLLALFCLQNPFPSLAFQSQTVAGRVIDATSQETLPGVNILVKGSTVGTVSNIDGEYKLDVPGPESVLVFSFVGYLSKEVTVGNQNEINVELQADLAQLDEVVVVGYGTVRKRD